jgi:hypothetical protein
LWAVFFWRVLLFWRAFFSSLAPLRPPTYKKEWDKPEKLRVSILDWRRKEEKKMKKSKKRERVVVESLSDLATAAFKKSLENRMVRQIETRVKLNYKI